MFSLTDNWLIKYRHDECLADLLIYLAIIAKLWVNVKFYLSISQSLGKMASF